MLKVDLARLRLEGEIAVNGLIPADAGLWNGTELRFAEAVEVVSQATLTAEGGVVVRGLWKARLVRNCGRCLEDSPATLEKTLILVYMPEGRADPSDPEVRDLKGRTPTLDLKPAIREEIVLEAPRYFLPQADRERRCTRCGIDVNQFNPKRGQTETETDPRWSALAALQTD